jgi:hypothetical protein
MKKMEMAAGVGAFPCASCGLLFDGFQKEVV